MKENKNGWQFPKALEIIKCKEGNKEFMKERPARRPFGNTVLICEYPIDDTAAEEPNAKLITWRLLKSGVEFSIKCDKFTLTRNGFQQVTGYNIEGITENQPVYLDFEQVAAVVRVFSDEKEVAHDEQGASIL